MPGIQELIALGIVALVAGRLVYRQLAKRRGPAKAGACGDCASAGPPPAEATVHFYRRSPDPSSGADDDPGPEGPGSSR